jgi:hypothetical protein
MPISMCAALTFIFSDFRLLCKHRGGRSHVLPVESHWKQRKAEHLAYVKQPTARLLSDTSDPLHMYGWFTLMTCLGSLVGAITWVALMLSRMYLFKAYDLMRNGKDPIEYFFNPELLIPDIRDVCDKFSDAARWQVVANVFIPAEFAIVCISKLLVLFRMLDFAVHDVKEESSRRWLLVQRATVAVVVCGVVVGLAGNSSSAHEYLKIPPVLSSAVTNASSKQLPQGLPDIIAIFIEAIPLAFEYFDEASALHVYQEVAEAVVLVLIVVLFAAAGLMCARRLNAVLRGLPGAGEEGEAGSSARRLKMQIVVTVSVVFLTFMLKTAFALFAATANQSQEISNLGACTKRLDIDSIKPNFCINSCSSQYVADPLCMFAYI